VAIPGLSFLFRTWRVPASLHLFVPAGDSLSPYALLIDVISRFGCWGVVLGGVVFGFVGVVCVVLTISPALSPAEGVPFLAGPDLVILLSADVLSENLILAPLPSPDLFFPGDSMDPCVGHFDMEPRLFRE